MGCYDCDKCKEECSGNTIRYNGPDLSCIGINPNDNFETVIQKIGEWICDLEGTGECCYDIIYSDTQELGAGSTGNNVYAIVPIGQAGTGFEITEDGDYEIEFNYNAMFFADGQLDVSLFIDGSEYNSVLRRISKNTLTLDAQSLPIPEYEVCNLIVTDINGLVTGQQLDIRAKATDNTNILVGNGHFIVRKIG